MVSFILHLNLTPKKLHVPKSPVNLLCTHIPHANPPVACSNRSLTRSLVLVPHVVDYRSCSWQHTRGLQTATWSLSRCWAFPSSSNPPCRAMLPGHATGACYPSHPPYRPRETPQNWRWHHTHKTTESGLKPSQSDNTMPQLGLREWTPTAGEAGAAN